MKIMNRTIVLALLMTLVLISAGTIAMGSSNDVITKSVISSPSGGDKVSVSVALGACGPIDLVIALDNTGSMGAAIGNIQAEMPTIISTAMIASGGDLKAGYITFNDSVVVHNNLTTNITAVTDSINATVVGGGAGAPESSDEAKNTFVNNLPAGIRADSAGFNGSQIGSFVTPYRAGATKIAVLITDAPPGGFNDIQDSADNLSLNTTHPTTALAKGIHVSDIFVPTGGDYAGQAALLEKDANITGGVYIMTAANGSGTGAAITAIVESCGGEPTPDTGRMTGGGSVFMKDGTRVTHGFELHCDATLVPNKLQINWDKKNKFHLESLTTAVCSDDPAIDPKKPKASFDTYEGTGMGRYNGVSGATAHWIFTDAGEPGKMDMAKIMIKDAGGATVLTVSGNLKSGNQQAHEE